MQIRAYITHKKDEHYSDCQDRFSINKDTKSIALSDGMSQSIFQKYWAEILVEKFTSTCDWVPNLASVKELSPIWKDKVLGIIKKQKEDGSPSAWRAERNIMDGLSAGATFAGIRFKGNQWECDVLGDSCLILIHENKIIQIVSSEDVTAFDSYPDYFDSNPKNDGKGSPCSCHGKFNPEDTILLVSDPFSDFLLKKKDTEMEGSLIEQLLSIDSHSDFEKVVENWRTSGMHNDDSTLIIIKQENGDSFDITYEDNIYELIETENNNSINQQTSALGNVEPLSQRKENSSSEIFTETEIEHNEQSKMDLDALFTENFYKSIETTLYKELRWSKKNKRKHVDKIIKCFKTAIKQLT